MHHRHHKIQSEISSNFSLNQAAEDEDDSLAVIPLTNMPQNIPHRQTSMKVNIREHKQQD